MRKNTVIASFVLFPVILTMTSTGATAQHHHGDVHLEVWDDHIVTGMVDEHSTIHDHRVYPSELGEEIPYYTDHPGFDSDTGTFPIGSEVGFNILDALLVWNGTYFEDADETMTISFAGLDVETADGFVEGFSIPVSNEGEWHKHFGFTLNAPHDVGVYLLTLELWNTNGSVGTSEPFFIVFNNEDDELVHEAAVEYTANVLWGSLHFHEISLVAGSMGYITLEDATPGQGTYFAYSLQLGSFTIPGCGGLQLELQNPQMLGFEVSLDGTVTLEVMVPNQAAGRTVHLQAVEHSNCRASNWITTTVE